MSTIRNRASLAFLSFLCIASVDFRSPTSPTSPLQLLQQNQFYQYQLSGKMGSTAHQYHPWSFGIFFAPSNSRKRGEIVDYVPERRDKLKTSWESPTTYSGESTGIVHEPSQHKAKACQQSRRKHSDDKPHQLASLVKHADQIW